MGNSNTGNTASRARVRTAMEASKVPAERKASVARSIDELRGRVARVTITTSLPGAEISIDDVSVGRSPLPGPQLVSAGRRKITATHDGAAPVNKVIDDSPEVTVLAQVKPGSVMEAMDALYEIQDSLMYNQIEDE